MGTQLPHSNSAFATLVRFGKLMLVALGFAILTAILSVVPSKHAEAANPLVAPVLVTNTTSQPVPVSLQGTGAVSGAVSATQSGIWTVGVNNFPVTQAVSFSNTSASTLFVDSDAPARQAVSGHCGADFTGSGGATCTLVSVPSGKVLVIDTLSVAVTPLTGKAVNEVACDVPVTDVSGSSATNRFHFGVPLEGSDGSFDWYESAIRVQIYAAGGKNVSCFANTVSNSGGSMAFDFAGHLVAP